MPLEAIRQLTSAGYAVIDLETTGLNPSDSTILEIGVLLVKDGVLVNSGSRLVATAVPPEITRITGITQAEVDQLGGSLKEALDWLCELAGDLPAVGHNYLRFDGDFIATAALKTGNKAAARLALPARVVDTAAIYKGRAMGLKKAANQSLANYQQFVLDQRVPGLRYALQVACAALTVDVRDCHAHRALGDVTMTQRLYQALVAPAPVVTGVYPSKPHSPEKSSALGSSAERTESVGSPLGPSETILKPRGLLSRLTEWLHLG